MEQKFKKSDGGIDLRALREFCRKEGKLVEYRKGEPAQWVEFLNQCMLHNAAKQIKVETM